MSQTTTNARYIAQLKERIAKCVNKDKAYLEGKIWESSQKVDSKNSWIEHHMHAT